MRRYVVRLFLVCLAMLTLVSCAGVSSGIVVPTDVDKSATLTESESLIVVSDNVSVIGVQSLIEVYPDGLSNFTIHNPSSNKDPIFAKTYILGSDGHELVWETGLVEPGNSIINPFLGGHFEQCVDQPYELEGTVFVYSSLGDGSPSVPTKTSCTIIVHPAET